MEGRRNGSLEVIKRFENRLAFWVSEKIMARPMHQQGIAKARVMS
jgi:hypothetical protein